ncbi:MULTISPECIES: hypothetical protein [unclassified Novosphingobium]|uniref:hypothetical protein n=1 Tax=unclassified Novosphingobium TaxID=2644732 RepID=UPI0013583B4A|nr:MULTISPECIES: hypothetical protein [unclassified Novosphingobium]
MDDLTKMEIQKLQQQIEVLKTMIEVQNIKNAGVNAVLQKLIGVAPGAVHVDDIEKMLTTSQGAGTHYRDAGHRRSDINDFLREVGLMRLV